MIVFRLGSVRYPVPTGEGARLYGGRWNRKGTAVLYTAESRALAAFEILVNTEELAGDYVVTPITIPDWVRIEIFLPTEWPMREVSQEIGTRWAVEMRSAVLAVPSYVIPRERNYLLNPAHPEFSQLVFGEPERFSFDARLQRAWNKQ